MKYTEGPNLSISLNIIAIEDACPRSGAEFLQDAQQPPLWRKTHKGCAEIYCAWESGDHYIWVNLKHERWQSVPMEDIISQVTLEFEEWIEEIKEAELTEEETE